MGSRALAGCVLLLLALSARGGSAQASSATELIAALEREQARHQSAAAGSLTEADSENYADLIGRVAALRDPRALKALLGAIETGKMARDGIVALGEVAVAPLVDLIRSGGLLSRSSAAMALNEIVNQKLTPPISAASLASIRSALLGALMDTDRFVRLSAIRGLDAFIDADVRVAMEKLAANDAFVTPEGRYLVRDAAAAWLAKHKDP